MIYKISPHVQIYKFPITAISSIANRVTGLGLTGLFISTGLYSLTGNDPVQQYKVLDDKYKTVLNYFVSFPILYHTYGGIRHIVWDKYPKLLNNSSVTKSSKLLIGFSLLSTYGINNYLPKIFK